MTTTLSSEAIIAAESAHTSGVYAKRPLAIVRGEGARLWDAEGNEYLDFQTGLAVNSVGHCHPAVVEAICAQAQRLIHVGNLFYSEPGMRLAQRLAQSSLGGKVHFAWIACSCATRAPRRSRAR